MNNEETVEATVDKKSRAAHHKSFWGVKRIIFGLGLISVVTVVCLGGVAYLTLGQFWADFKTTTAATIPLFINQPVYNRIAFVGNDDNLWLVSADGQELRQLTNDGKGYRFPTWAPDGSHLAYIGPDQANNSALYVTPTNYAAPTILFNEPESTPFYLYWSPDSDSVTFLTQEKISLAMRLVNVEVGDSRVLGEGNPFYWVWSPAGDKLLMHVGGARARSDQAHLSLLENQAEADRIQLDLAPGQFQAPDWSADGSYFYYIAANEQGQEAIYKTNAATLEQTVITDLAGFTYMVLSPDSQHIAYVQIEEGDQPPLGSAYLVDADGRNHRRLTDNPVASLYWSPDGRKLAVLTLAVRGDGSTAKVGGLAAPLPQEILFRWLIYNLDTDTLEILATFSPTRDFVQTVPYFDQYHRSLTFWSPDSRYFVMTKEKENRLEGTVWVHDVTGEEEARQVGEGTLAVWSWR